MDIDPDLLQRGGLLLDVDGARATITLDRPDALNAQLPSTWRALRQIGERLGPEIRIVVVQGSGRSFSAGLDRRMFAGDGIPGEAGFLDITSAGPDAGQAIIEEFQRGFTWLADPQRVSIAAVHGHAIGAGFQLALACDIRVAAEDALFTMAETSLGLVPDLTGTLSLVRAVGYARAWRSALPGVGWAPRRPCVSGWSTPWWRLTRCPPWWTSWRRHCCDQRPEPRGRPSPCWPPPRTARRWTSSALPSGPPSSAGCPSFARRRAADSSAGVHAGRA